MVIECPHCHRRVLPSENNICPACRKDISDTRGVDPNLVSLVLSDCTKLPPYCYSCNSPTERYVKIEEKVEIGGDSPLAKAFLTLTTVLSPLVGHVTLSAPRTGGEKHAVNIRIPQCEQCAKKGKPTPEHVNFKQETMTLIVHRGFRDRVYRIQEERSFRNR